MGRKIQTIYEYFSDYTEKEIDDVILELSNEEKSLIDDRYGKDLHNPVRSANFTVDKKGKFYSTLLPKIKKILVERHVEEEKPIVEETKEDINLVEKVFDLVMKRKTNKEICEILKIDSTQLYSLLLNLKNNVN